METKPFDNVENQIGLCGIWCGSCPAGNGSVVELTRRYEEIVKKNRALGISNHAIGAGVNEPS